LGLGPSSISRIPEGYAQNETATGICSTKVVAGELATALGLLLSEQDNVRGRIIERLMCEFGFSKGELLQSHGTVGWEAWNFALSVAGDNGSKLCRISEDKFDMAAGAFPLVRVLASKFDEWLAHSNIQYSQAV
jgi:oxygen-independent coproporphyrinogen III oxidase